MKQTIPAKWQQTSALTFLVPKTPAEDEVEDLQGVNQTLKKEAVVRRKHSYTQSLVCRGLIEVFVIFRLPALLKDDFFILDPLLSAFISD